MKLVSFWIDKYSRSSLQIILKFSYFKIVVVVVKLVISSVDPFLALEGRGKDK